MSSSKLGRSENLDRFWSEQLLAQRETNVHIESVTRENIRSLQEVKRYPYEGQLKLSGTFSYDLPGRRGGSHTVRGDYEYRTASGLFLLNTQTDRPRAREVFDDINNFISESAEIYDSLSLDRRSIWEFLDNADVIDKLVVRAPEGQYDATLLPQLVGREDPITTIEESDLSSFEKEALISVVNKHDLPESLESIHELDIDWFETSIEEFKAGFWYNKELAEISFKRGSLQLDADIDIAKEYLLQLFERDVLFQSNDHEL